MELRDAEIIKLTEERKTLNDLYDQSTNTIEKINQIIG